MGLRSGKCPGGRGGPLGAPPVDQDAEPFFEAEIGLEEGLAELVDWWRAEKAVGEAPVLASAEAR